MLAACCQPGARALLPLSQAGRYMWRQSPEPRHVFFLSTSSIWWLRASPVRAGGRVLVHIHAPVAEGKSTYYYSKE